MFIGSLNAAINPSMSAFSVASKVYPIIYPIASSSKVAYFLFPQCFVIIIGDIPAIDWLPTFNYLVNMSGHSIAVILAFIKFITGIIKQLRLVFRKTVILLLYFSLTCFIES